MPATWPFAATPLRATEPGLSPRAVTSRGQWGSAFGLRRARHEAAAGSHALRAEGVGVKGAAGSLAKPRGRGRGRRRLHRRSRCTLRHDEASRLPQRLCDDDHDEGNDDCYDADYYDPYDDYNSYDSYAYYSYYDNYYDDYCDDYCHYDCDYDY